MIDASEQPQKIDGNGIVVRAIRLHKLAFELREGAPVEQPAMPAGPVELPFDIILQRSGGPATFHGVRFGIRMVNVPLPFEIEVVYEGLFQVPDESISMLAAFVRYNAVAMLVPYVRETLSAAVARAGLPQLLVPPLNVVEMVDALEPIGK